MNDKIRERIEKIRRGEVPEGYRKRLNWIIPNEWELMSGSDLFSFIRNGFVGTVTPFYTDIGIPYLQGMNIKDGNIVKEKMFYVTEEFHRAHPNSQLKYGDVVVVQSGAVGECAVIGKDFEQGNCHALIIMTPKEYVNSFWFAAVLNSPLRRHLLAGIITGNTIQHILASDMKRISVPTPSYAEQNYIAKVLATQDRLLLLQRQRIDQIKKLKEAYLDKLFPKAGSNVPEIRFAGFTDLWEQRKLGEITDIASAARVHKEEWATSGVAFFRSSDVVAAYKNTENEKAFITEELYEKLSAISGKLEKDDILITGGGSIGIPYIVPNNEPLYSKDADLIWIKHSPEFDSNYLYAYITAPTFRAYIGGISHIGTIAHYTIEQVKATPVGLPTIAEQRQIGNFFRSLDTLITLHQRKLDEMKKLKKGLMQLLLTGIVRVGE